MYAVIEVGAKQFTVKKGDIIDARMRILEKGKELSLEKVLLISKEDAEPEIGRPYVKNARVKAQVLAHCRDGKAVSFKYRRRKSSHWKKGHRQQLTRLLVKDIEVG